MDREGRDLHQRPGARSGGIAGHPAAGRSPRGLADPGRSGDLARSVDALPELKRHSHCDLRGNARVKVRGSLETGVRTAGVGEQLAPGIESLRALEVGLPVSGSAPGQRAQRADGRRWTKSVVHSTQARRVVMRGLAAAVALLIVSPQIAFAQFRGVRAELTPLVESEARSGASVRAACLVALPAQLHVQSDAPRDPSLIPTVLTIDPPDG